MNLYVFPGTHLPLGGFCAVHYRLDHVLGASDRQGIRQPVRGVYGGLCVGTGCLCAVPAQRHLCPAVLPWTVNEGDEKAAELSYCYVSV